MTTGSVVSGFRVYNATSGSPVLSFSAGTADTLSTNFTGLIAGATFSYTVSAISEAGEGLFTMAGASGKRAASSSDDGASDVRDGGRTLDHVV